MCNNLTFLSNPVKRVQLLIHLTLWTFSVDSYEEGVGVDGGIAGFCLQWGLGGNPQWVKTHIFATFSKKVLPSLSQSDNGILQCCNFAIAFEMQRRVKAAAQHSSSESRLCVRLALHLYLITSESGSDLSPGTN